MVIMVMWHIYLSERLFIRCVILVLSCANVSYNPCVSWVMLYYRCVVRCVLSPNSLSMRLIVCFCRVFTMHGVMEVWSGAELLGNWKAIEDPGCDLIEI